MEYATEKWGDRPHYRGEVEVLGEDEFGLWMWGAAGRNIYRGDDVVFVSTLDALTLCPPDAWWHLAWWIGHDEVELYVNINTPARFEPHRVVAVDLDLDVVRLCDGRVEIVDRDEFEEHQVLYGYPADVIEATEAAAQGAFRLAIDNVAPFDGIAARAWIEKARA